MEFCNRYLNGLTVEFIGKLTLGNRGNSVQVGNPVHNTVHIHNNAIHSNIRRQSKRWRRKYIRSLVSLAGAWGGTVMSLEALLSKKVATMPSSIDVPAQHFESPYWLMPAKDAFGEEIVATLNLPTTNGIDASYSMSNITQLFFLKAMNNFTTGGVNYTEIGIRYEAVRANSRSGKRLETEAPDVEIYCLYSVDVDTAKT